MPNTIAQNLTRLVNAKEAIRAAIAEKGVIVGEEDGLGDFSNLILSIPSGSADLNNAALRLIDWEGTVLKEYTAAQVASLTELPEPSSFSTKVDRELLTFQGWNWLLTDIKSWVTAHEGECLTVGAIYTTTDGKDHTYWDNPIFGTDMRFASVQKQGTSSLGANAFQNCTSLKSINIPNGVTSIGISAFIYCTSLKSLSLSNDITTIGASAFQNCTQLESISIPNNVTSIGASAFQDCSSLKKVALPNGIRTITTNILKNCAMLKEVGISSLVTSIGGYAFQNCGSLENLSIPESVTSIGGGAFQGCMCLRYVVIPESVTSIGSKAYYGCISINAILVYGTPDIVNVDAFTSIYNGCSIYVPRENLAWFETATNWATYYAQDKIVAIEDNVEFLQAIGIDI